MTDRRLATFRARPADAAALRYAPGRDPADRAGAFYVDHRQCGELDAGVQGATVWFDCDCGASMARRADEDDHAARD